MPGDQFYYGKPWQKLRAQTKARWKRAGLPCGICQDPIDWNARPIVDHIISRRQAPHREMDPSNLQVVCHQCNSRKAKGVKVVRTGADGFPEGWGG